MEMQPRITIMKTRLVQVGALAALSVAAVAPTRALRAQGTQAAQEQVQLAFGYECDDKFVVRNDGTQPMTVEYGITGAEQRSLLQLRGKESIELESAAASPLELWVNGRIVATEQKGNRSCAANPAGRIAYDQASPAVVVRRLEEADYVGYAQPAYYAPRVVVVAAFPQYGYRSSAVVVAPLSGAYGAAGYGAASYGATGYGAAANGGAGYSAAGYSGGGYAGDVRVNQARQVGRVDQIGAGRSASPYVEPRRPVQRYSNGGREWQSQTASGGGRERQTQQHASSGRAGRGEQPHETGGHARQTQGDHRRSHRR
jgi:hypothetical protein